LPSEPCDTPSAAVLSTTAQTFLRERHLEEELFGPSTLIVTCGSAAELAEVARSLPGQLTVSVHGTPDDMRRFSDTIALLCDKAGRVIFNGFPTGVEVCHAMQHGGPYPATTDSRSTSVGSAAIFRFARPICWQGAPQELLPPELQDANPLSIRRLVDGEWTRDPLRG
jgi:NADP-dependent aldehyde dehydrogenase